MNRTRILATTLLALSAAATVPVPRAAAQSLTTGELSGVVRSSLGESLSEVQLTIRRTGGEAAIEVETDAAGRFVVPLLATGEYEVLAERLGYLPVLVSPIPVRPDRRLDVELTLQPAEGAVEEPVRAAFRGGALATGSRPGHSRVFGDFEIRDLPHREGDLTELVRFSSLGEQALEVEGLPSTLGGLVVGGVPYTPAGVPAGGADGMTGMLLPLRAAGGAELLAGAPDVEWPGSAGALLSMALRSESGGLGGEVSGAWSPGDAPTTRRAGALLGGSLLADSAHGWVFVEAQQRSVPVRFWPEGGEPLAEALVEAGVDTDALVAGTAGETQRVNVGGAFDWRLAEGRSIELFGLYGRGESDHAVGSLTGQHLPVSTEGDDLLAGATATGWFSDALAAQAHVGFSRSSRDYGPGPTTTGLGEAAVAFTSASAQLGDPSYPALIDRSELSAQGTLHLRTGPHRLKGGIGARFAQHDQTRAYGRGGLYLFGDAPGLSSRTGVFHGLEGGATASFSVTEYFAYGQNTWRMAPGLDVTTGLRYELEALPSGDLLPNRRWQELTGIDNAGLHESTGDVGVVAGFDWNVAERDVWRVRGAFAIQRGDVPVELLAEALTHDGRIGATAAVGDVTQVTPLGPRLTVLAPGLEPPLTTRGSVGLSRALGQDAVLHLGAVIRQTENLPRRTDLNLPVTAPFQDQHGRPVFGTLLREGPLLYPEPNRNRRFAEFDAVSSLTSAASSRYWGVTAALEKRFGGLKAAGFYTYSATEDDWLAPGGAPLDALAPFTDDRADWAEGTSDFDIPHRLSAMAELALPFAPGVRLGGSWLWSSGRPFTPGFGRGIDANADGVAGNDPAFIDSQVEGVLELMADHSCLTQQEGRFAERNACRADDRTLFDAWAALRLPIAGARPELRVEALGLATGGSGPVDTALYRLDPDGEVVTDPVTRRVTVPLIVNPGFGRSLRASPEATRIRISLRMVF